MPRVTNFRILTPVVGAAVARNINVSGIFDFDNVVFTNDEPERIRVIFGENGPSLSIDARTQWRVVGSPPAEAAGGDPLEITAILNGQTTNFDDVGHVEDHGPFELRWSVAVVLEEVRSLAGS